MKYLHTRRAQQLLSWLLPLVLLAVSLALFGIRYHTNDDATLANIAAGAYGSDRIHLVYVNLLFGLALQPLYGLAAGCNWYVLVQLALVVVACAALCRVAMERFGTVRGACLFAAVGVPFSAEVLYRFQYVKNSGLCVAAGLLLVAVTLGKPTRRTALGIALALAGSLLRWDCFLAVGALSAPLLLGHFFALDKPQKRRAVYTMAVLFALVFGAKAVDWAAYQADDGWRAYTEYNAARTQMSDYKADRLDADENVFAEQGLSDNDYAMLLDWNYYDGDVFSAQRVAQLAAQVPSIPLAEAAKDTLKTALGLLHGTSYRYAFALLVLAGALLLRLDRRALPFWGTLAMLGLLLFYLMAKGRFPSYVEVPLMLATCIFLVACAALGHLRRALPLTGWVLGAALLAALYVPTAIDTYQSAQNYRQWATLEEPYIQAMSADKDHLYLLATLDIGNAAGYDVWHPRGEGFFSNIVAYGGWLSHAPYQEAALADYGLQNPLTDAVDNDAVYLSYHSIDNAAQYAAEHLGTTVVATADGTNPYAPYRLHSQSAP